MRKLFGILAILAIIAIFPISGVLAETTVWSGTGNEAVVEPISVVVTTVSPGTYDFPTNTWNYTLTGAGTAVLTMTVTNNSPSTAYTVTAHVSTVTPSAGTITTSWSPATRYLAAGGGTQVFTLTVVTSAEVPLGNYSFTMSLTR